MSADPIPESQNGHRPRPPSIPGVADLGAFRGRTERSGVPILPPGWRPEREVPGSERPATTVVPVARPAPVPPGGSLVIGSTGREVRAVARADSVGGKRPDVDEPTTRVLRRIRPWSVWKMTLAFQVCMVAVMATAGAILWAVAVGLGVLDNVEGFVEDLGFEDFAFDGGAMLRAFVIGGLIVSFASALLASVFATMFNLLSDLTGGIEAETAPPRPRRRKRRSEAETVVPAVAVDAADGRPPDVDLTGDPDAIGAGAEVDHIQLAIDDLLREEPPPGTTA